MYIKYIKEKNNWKNKDVLIQIDLNICWGKRMIDANIIKSVYQLGEAFLDVIVKHFLKNQVSK